MRKKLIEVALPLEAINVASAREKSIRHGHPSTLHLWWARRPLAACRAVLFASLVDDPDSDPMFAGDEELAATKRAELFNLIEDLVKWENSNNPAVINRARAEIARCVASQKIENGELKKDSPLTGGATPWDLKHLLASPEQVNSFLAEHAPPVLDPFAGGGSIPLEAQRLGLRAYASDLNPVAVLINKALIEIPPKFAGRPPVHPGQSKKLLAKEWNGAEGLAEEVQYYGQWIRNRAKEKIGHLYPDVTVTTEMARGRTDLERYVGRSLPVIAWIWARTVASPDPSTRHAHVPLVSTFWLSTKEGKRAWLRPMVDRAANRFQFVVCAGDPPQDFNPSTGTVSRAGGRCLLSGSPIPFDHIRREGQEGKLGETLIAIVADGIRERVFIDSLDDHEVIAKRPHNIVAPETALPRSGLGFRVQPYGLVRHRHLFTDRQLVALSTFREVIKEVEIDDPEQAAAVVTYLALALSKSTDYWSNLCIWRSDPKNLGIGHVFARHALQMVWDFAEANPFSNSSGNWDKQVGWITGVLEHHMGDCSATVMHGVANQAVDRVPNAIVSTDPPYYDNIGYADLSDFFYVWLRDYLANVHPEVFSTVLTPKSDELIADPSRHHGVMVEAQRFFERGLAQVFGRVRAAHATEYPFTVFYAFKQAEADDDDLARHGTSAAIASTGWETMLQALISEGFEITGTWPIRTEGSTRLRNIGSNALASSIVLVCRPRLAVATAVSRREFLAVMRSELPDALRKLQGGNIAPVDLAQASIGPGMAVFSRYSRVLESDGSPMRVRTALQLINQTLDEVLAEQEGEFDPDTRWAIAWFEQRGHEEGPYGEAETLSTAKNVSVKGLEEAGILKAKSGKVRLLRRDEYPEGWEPAADGRAPIWEKTQQLLRTLDKEGETGAARLLRQLGADGEIVRDLAYRLYTTCERKKWAQEALAYNGLVVAWPELSRLARQMPVEKTQAEMFG